MNRGAFEARMQLEAIVPEPCFATMCWEAPLASHSRSIGDLHKVWELTDSVEEVHLCLAGKVSGLEALM